MLFGAKKDVCPDGNTTVTSTLFGLYAQYSVDSNLVVHIITTVFYSMKLKNIRTFCHAML